MTLIQIYGYLATIIPYKRLVLVQKTQQASSSINSYRFKMKAIY